MIPFVLLLALLTAFPPLATDMYLPAIPYLVGENLAAPAGHC